MRPRKIFANESKQKEHIRRFNEIKLQVFRDGSRRQVIKLLEDHEGKQISDAILGIVSKVDILDDDFRDLRKSIESFWDNAFKKGTSHNSYCLILRDVWRCAFHVAASAQSVYETIGAAMNKFSHKQNRKGETICNYWITGFKNKCDELTKTPIYKFNYQLRGYLYHVRLSNPDWVGFKDYTTGERIERFILHKEILLSLVDRDLDAQNYVRDHSITVQGQRVQKGDKIYGLDLLAHFQRYRLLLKKLSLWTIKELENPDFGKNAGIQSCVLREYHDLERASMGISRNWKRCKHCGGWSSK